MSFENSSEIFKLQKLVKSSLLEINKLKMEIAQLKDEQNSLMSNDEFETLKIESEESLKQKENEILAQIQQAELEIRKIEAVTYCEGCRKEYPTVEHGKICPYCGSENTYLLKGNEFIIKEIEAE